MEFLASFILALLISMAFAVRSRKGASFTHLVIFFFILFMSGLAGQYWIIPFGPVLWGVSWLPLIFILLIVTLLFAAPLPLMRNKRTNPTEEGNAPAVFAISIFIWILLLVLLVAILIGFARRSDTSPELYEKEKISIVNHKN